MIQRPKGCHDIYGRDAKIWKYVDSIVDAVMEKYNYGYIRTPIFEASELYHRGVGEASDVVRKEKFLDGDLVGLVLLDDPIQVAVDGFEAGLDRGVRRGVDVAAGDRSELSSVRLDDPPSNDGEPRVDAENNHLFRPFGVGRRAFLFLSRYFNTFFRESQRKTRKSVFSVNPFTKSIIYVILFR